MASRVITKICELTATILHSLNHSKPHVSFTLAKLTFSIADLLGGARHLNYLGLSRQNVKDVRNLMQFIDNHYFNFGVYDRIPESNIYQRNKHAWDHMINCTRDLVVHLEDGRYLEGLMKNLSRFLSITDPYMLEKLMERIYYVEPVEWSLDTKELTQKDWKNWTGWVKKLSYTMVRTDSALLEKFLEIIYYIPQALVKQSTLYPFSRSNLIKEKWNNIRDAFTRSLMKKSGQTMTKNYLYNDVLQFLLRTTDKDETESSIHRDNNNDTAETQEEKEMETELQQSEYEETLTSSGGVGKRQPLTKRVTPMNDEIDRKILKSLEKIEPNEDEAFFISVLPSLRAFYADDKIYFIMGVLKLIKDIKKSLSI
uniref:BESS domain-containing protein n=1 Tax=Timema tahoe TaxID=61484 RepID=A0A7R9NWJ4_9NEOP|nr:unnamed protein product [Timema tahoe]